MRWFLLAVLAFPLVAALERPARAVEQRPPATTPALLSADRVSYDDQLGLIVASGHVEISQSDRVLLADTVTYNQHTDVVTASGNVSILEPNGEVAFANYFELTQGLKEGVAQNFRLLMTDKSRFAAAGARREGGVLTEMVNGVFSPCNLCKDDPERPPLWQIKAARIIHYEDTHDIVDEDAVLEMWGIPVAYTPYFSYPDPTVKRRTGFLPATYGDNTYLGYLVKLPYFWAIDDDKDLTIDPVLMTKTNPVMNGQYRERWGNAQIDLQGSLTDAEAFNEAGTPKPGTQLRGNFKGTGTLNIDEDWRTGFAAERETDIYYLSRYKIIYNQPTTLTSNAFLEGYYGMSYNALNAYTFQDTRLQVNLRDLPIVAPIYQVNYRGEPGDYGQYWTVDANAMNLFRPSGVYTRRISQRTAWEVPYTSSIGDKYSLAFSLQSDGYDTNSNLDPNAPVAVGSRTAARLLPQAKLDWRYPWARSDGDIQEVIEPHFALIAGTQGRNRGIPNEDSTDFEFDEQNLFNFNPFPGVDRVDGGERAVYGVSVGAYGNKGGSTSLFLGQMYQLHRDRDAFTGGTGLEQNLSDVVGRLQIKPMTFLNFDYRFELQDNNLKPQRSEVTMSGGTPPLGAGLTFIDLTQQVPGEGLTKVEQFGPNVTSNLIDHWTVSAYILRDLVFGQFRNYGLTLTYRDECLTVTGALTRNYTYTIQTPPSSTFLVTVIFKDLGDIAFGGTSTP
ncbi:MAG: LPS-assembly protein LptD [Alphaproteobacteria bacterium]